MRVWGESWGKESKGRSGKEGNLCTERSVGSGSNSNPPVSLSVLFNK